MDPASACARPRMPPPLTRAGLRSPAPAAAATHSPAPPDTARSGMHCSLPQPRNLGRLLHLRFRSPEAAELRIRPLPHRIYASLGWICIDAVFFRLVVVPVFIALELGPYVGLGLARPSWSVGLGCSRCGDRRRLGGCYQRRGRGIFGEDSPPMAADALCIIAGPWFSNNQEGFKV